MSTRLETYSYDGLIAGDFPITTDRQTLLSGQDLERGALLGKITASGKLTQCDSSAVDGSQTPYAILVEDADASDGDTVIDVYLTGTFSGAKIGVLTGDDIDDFKDDLRVRGIMIVTTVPA
ncbi:MAG: head decoration protein [Spirochaetes bacterium]|nr:head decoration protein [Spirochaetota bacterium]